ncbi:hypothetical protein HOP50_03g21550 [Chloropicon primus]|nr:hypothetical protein HOP50_03g21550 [Chloropicon primus]
MKKMKMMMLLMMKKMKMVKQQQVCEDVGDDAGSASSCRVVTRAVLKPPSGKATGKGPRDDLFRTKNASALAYQSDGALVDAKGLKRASALEQVSSVTSAYRALLSTEDDYENAGDTVFPTPSPYLM